jgi:thioredoxin-related protein
MKWFDTGKNTCPMCRKVSKNIYTTYMLKMYTNRFVVVQRKLDKLEKVKFNTLSEYWQETVQDLEHEYMEICAFFDTYDE